MNSNITMLIRLPMTTTAVRVAAGTGAAILTLPGIVEVAGIVIGAVIGIVIGNILVRRDSSPHF